MYIDHEDIDIDSYYIRIILIYKKIWHLYITYSAGKSYFDNEYIICLSIAYFVMDRFDSIWIKNENDENRLTNHLRDMLHDINNFGINMSYYKLLSILKVIPIISKIYDQYETIYKLLPNKIKQPDIFTIIANYL